MNLENNIIYINKCKNIYKEEFTYENCNYISSRDYVTITCKIHGNFQKRASLFLTGVGCKKCKINNGQYEALDDKIFFNKASFKHNNKYKYYDDYLNMRTKIKINCPKHGDFYQLPSNHIRGKGCLKCSKENTNYNYSSIEIEIINFLLSIGIKNISHSNKNILKNKEIDIYLPDYNIGIEINGVYWHSSLFKDKFYHYNKSLEAKNKNIFLLQIFDYEWITKQEIIKNRLINLFKKNTNKIYAKNTFIKEINKIESLNFLKNNYLEIVNESQINIGLFYIQNNKEYLISVMTFNKIENNIYNLNEYCSNKKINIIGGFSKLLKYFEIKYKPKNIQTIINKRLSDNNFLIKFGFKFLKENEPNFYYTDKYKIFKNLNQINKENYHYIFDCGNLIYEKQF